MGTVADRIEADAARFFNPRDFATPASYTHAGETNSLFILFYDNYRPDEVMVGDFRRGVNSTNSATAAICRSADVLEIARGDTLLVHDTTYYVTDPQEAAEGFRLVILSKHPPHG